LRNNYDYFENNSNYLNNNRLHFSAKRYHLLFFIDTRTRAKLKKPFYNCGFFSNLFPFFQKTVIICESKFLIGTF